MIFTIAAKELKALFASPLAWVVLTLVQATLGLLFLRWLDEFLQRESQLVGMPNVPGLTESVAVPFFHNAFVVFLFAVPLLAMRLVAEERRNQTLVLLMSAPVSMTEIVLGKFAGLAVFLLAIVALITLMPLSLALGARIDYGLLAGLVAGLVLMVASFAAVSVYISCLTAQPVVAAFGAFIALLAMALFGEIAEDGLRSRGVALGASLARVISPLKNFEPFLRGVLDTYAVACSLLLVAVFLTLAIRQLDAQRLR
jgi:gliding motility-associated transport system permease protein